MELQINEDTGRFILDPVKVLPQSLYDASRAQTAHHIKWILNCAYPEGLPDSFGTPFYIGNDSRLVLSPHVISSLVSCQVYHLACSNIFASCDAQEWSCNHTAILTQLASKWSIYPMEQSSQLQLNSEGDAKAAVGAASGAHLEGAAGMMGAPLTEQLLSQTLPFRLASHVALIESLIMARCIILSPISRVVAQTKTLFQKECPEEFATGIEEMLPYDIEDALLFWMNHCLICLKKRNPSAKALEEVMELFDLVEACDGLVIAAVMALFSPRLLPVQRLSEQNHSMSAPSESLAINCIYNIQIVQMYCKLLQSNPTRLFTGSLSNSLTASSVNILHLELEDFLYPNKLTKSAFVLFMAELFHIFSTAYEKSLPSLEDSSADDAFETANSRTDECTAKPNSSVFANEPQASPQNYSNQLDAINRSASVSDDCQGDENDSTVEAMGVGESIDLHSLKLLHSNKPTVSTTTTAAPAASKERSKELMNWTYVQESADDKGGDERRVEGAEVQTVMTEMGLEDDSDRQEYEFEVGRASAIPSNLQSNRALAHSMPLGASTPHGEQSRSPLSARKSFANAYDRSISMENTPPPNVMSGRDTYSVRHSHNPHQHRPASELFIDSSIHFESERPRSEVVESGLDNRPKGFGSASKIVKTPPEKDRGRYEQKSTPSLQNDQEEFLADNFKSLRAEMEMKRMQIQKQRAHEDKERLKQRQKISEAAFFKAIQPKAQSHGFPKVNAQQMQQQHQNAQYLNSLLARNPSMSNISVQTSIDAPESTCSMMSPGGKSGFEEYTGDSYRRDGRQSDIHRTASLDWSKSGLSTPLDNSGNKSYRGPHSFRGFNTGKAGSTFDMASAPNNRLMSGTGGRGGGGGVGFNSANPMYPDQQMGAGIVPGVSQEKVEKQILIEQNLKLAQELKYLKAQYANEMGFNPEYGVTSQQLMYPPPHNTQGHNSSLMASSGNQMGSWGQKLNSSFNANYPLDHNAFMASLNRSNTSTGPQQGFGYAQNMNMTNPVQVGMNNPMIAQNMPPQYVQQNFDNSQMNYNHGMMTNSTFSGGTVQPGLGGGLGGGEGVMLQSSPMGSQTILSDEPQNTLSNSNSFQTIEPPANEDDNQSYIGANQDDDAFHPDQEESEYSHGRQSHQENNRLNARVNSFRNEADTLEAPYGVAELVNVNNTWGDSRRYSERETASPVAERRRRRSSRNQQQTASNRNSKRYSTGTDNSLAGDEMDDEERGVASSRVPPSGVALIIGEEGNVMKPIDYETKKKLMLTKRMEKLRADQKTREESMKSEKEKLKEQQRKLQLEIDSHRRQEKLKDKMSAEVDENIEAMKNRSRQDKQESNWKPPAAAATTNTHPRRPKAKVAPRVKNSASSQGLNYLNSSNGMSNRNHSVAADEARGDRSHTPAAPAASTLSGTQADTLEAPYGVAELVNVNNTWGDSRRYSERETASPVAERRRRRSSRNQQQTASNRNSKRYSTGTDNSLAGDEMDDEERGVASSRVPPSGVALIIGEEGNVMKPIDYETKKKLMLTKRMEKLRADQKTREESMKSEKEKLKEQQRKLQLEIDSHRRQEKLKDKMSAEVDENIEAMKNRSRQDKQESNWKPPAAAATTNTHPRRPKAKVAPRVKNSASSQGLNYLNSSNGMSNRNHSVAADEARGDRSHTPAAPAASTLSGTPLKLYVKPQSRGNKQIIINAINQCVLPGAVNADLKGKVIHEINSLDEETKNFLLLFRDHNMKYRAMYSYEPDTGLILKIQGTGPNQIKDDMIAELYKYNSGCKSFSSIPSKTMSVSVDGFTILNHLWKPIKRM